MITTFSFLTPGC